MPEFFNFLHLGEETVPTNIKSPTISLNRAADTTDDAVAFLHDDRATALYNFVRGGEACGATADDDDGIGITHG